MDKLPKVSVVIVNYNGRRNLGKILDSCLSSVLGNYYSNFEVLFVDNGSNDNSREYIEQKYGKVKNLKIICLDKNYGLALGNNKGVNRADAESKYLVFVNTDVEMPSDWLIRAVKFLESSPDNVAGVNSVIQDASIKKYIAEVYLQYPSAQFFISFFDKYIEIENRPVEVDVLSGEACMVRKEVFENVNGYDEHYYIYFDEADLSWRIRLIGHHILLNPELRIIHYRSTTTRKIFSPVTVEFYRERNRICSCVKNLSAFSLVAFLISEICRFIALTCASILNKRYKLSICALIHVLWRFVKSQNLRYLIIERRKIQSTRRLSDHEVFNNCIRMIPLRELRAPINPRPSLIMSHALYRIFARGH